MAKKIFNDDDYKLIMENSYNGAINKNWIMETFDVSYATAYRAMQKLGLKKARDLLGDKECEEILKASYNKEIDVNWIMGKFKVSYSTAYRTMQKLELTHASIETIEIIKKYLTGINTDQLAEEYNMTTVNIVNLLKRRGIERRKSRYYANFRYFECIDSEDKAYWLGFIYADGNLFRNTLKIAISEDDIELLYKFKKDINSNHNILIENRSNKHPNWSNSSRIEITNHHIREDLIKHGVIENKTFKLEFPTTVPKHLIHHFIRGYFDGDGSFSMYTGTFTRNGKIYSSNKYEVSIVGAEKFLLSIVNLLSDEIKFNKLTTRHKERNNNIRTLKVTGMSNCKKFLDYIYEDATIYLNRKYQKYQNID